jgi:hypothetical protein
MSSSEIELQVVVDRERALFSTWYEIFPRSCSPEPGKHGTFKDCEALLPEIAGMGFDVLYLPFYIKKTEDLSNIIMHRRLRREVDFDYYL